jgi:acid stress-induced BolA-like protein IbaG/YrbA
MALQILSSPSKPEDADKVVDLLRAAIEKEFKGDDVQVEATSPGHFEIRVQSASFEGQPRVRQQQRVYAAIAHLMKGDAAPVHAVDRMTTLSRPA